MELLIPLIPLLGVVAIVLLSSLNWRRTVKVVFLLVVFEGALRKWVLPQASDLIIFLKDIVLLGAYLRYYLGSEPKYPFRLSGIRIALFMAISWCIVQAFNPSLGSLIVGFFGLKIYFFYIPLMWMLPALFKSQEELYRFLRNYLLLTIPVCLLAIAQFFSPPSSPINVYAGGQEANAFVSDAVRVTGTFSYISGYTAYLLVCFSLLIPLLTLKQPRFWRWLTLIEAFLVVGTSFMTGARGLLLFEILFVVGYACVLGLTQPATATSSAKQLIVPIILLSAIVPSLFSKAIEAFSNRVETTASAGDENFVDRTFSAFREPMWAMQFKGFNGYGIGATYQGLSALRRGLQLPPGEALPPSEGELGRIVLEIGPFGFLFWYGLRLVLLFYLWRVFWKLKNPFLGQLALAAFLFQSINITGQMVFNHTFATYYWFFNGFIFLLPELENRQHYILSYQHWLDQQHVYPTHFPGSSD